MKGQFPGYFTPSKDDFTALWRDCIFSFDANVLLQLYRSTAETQEVFPSGSCLFLIVQPCILQLRTRFSCKSRFELWNRMPFPMVCCPIPLRLSSRCPISSITCLTESGSITFLFFPYSITLNPVSSLSVTTLRSSPCVHIEDVSLSI
jgi:hypothetical protein